MPKNAREAGEFTAHFNIENRLPSGKNPPEDFFELSARQ